jgi:CRP-like cAMP-binding protein
MPLLDPLFLKLAQFAPLSDETRWALVEIIGGVTHYQPREDIVTQGDETLRVNLVLEGWAARYATLPDGRRETVAYLLPGDLCDVYGTMLEVMDHSIGALTPVTAVYFPASSLFELMNRDKALAAALWWATLVDEAILRQWLVSLGARSAEARLAHLLCELLLRCSAVGLVQGSAFHLPLNQQQLADATGMSIIHMNRTVSGLRARGLVSTVGGGLTVPSFDALSAVCDFDATYLHQTRASRVRASIT